jgi:hypothetical protein
VSSIKFLLVLTLLLVFASHFVLSVTFAEVREDQASSALADAEAAVVSAYQAVLKTEEAGANVTGLLAQLNEAGEYLDRARMEYRMGDFEKAIDFAGSGRSIGVEVQNAAVKLKNSAWNESVQHSLFTMIASIVCMTLIMLGSLWVWHPLKKAVQRRVSES